MQKNRFFHCFYGFRQFFRDNPINRFFKIKAAAVQTFRIRATQRVIPKAISAAKIPGYFIPPSKTRRYFRITAATSRNYQTGKE